jgi:hypothetical protein
VTGPDLVNSYLAQLEGSASTQRQRSWALRDLLSFASGHREHGEHGEHGRIPARALLDPDLLAAWVAHAAADPAAPASQAGLRARASAARALDQFARDGNLLGSGTTGGAVALRLAAPPDPADVDRSAARRLLTVAAGPAPWPVHPGVWARFAAHAHLAAGTGAGESTLAAMTLADLSTNRAEPPADLPDRARLTIDRWLAVRAALVAGLEGSDPGALWLRVHPSTNRRTGQLAPAGLAISSRGLRLAFTHMVVAAAGVDPRTASVRPRDVRALGREPSAMRTRSGRAVGAAGRTSLGTP